MFGNSGDDVKSSYELCSKVPTVLSGDETTGPDSAVDTVRAWSFSRNRNRFQFRFQWNRLLHKWNWNRIGESGETMPDHGFAVETEKNGGFHLVTCPEIFFFIISKSLLITGFQHCPELNVSLIGLLNKWVEPVSFQHGSCTTQVCRRLYLFSFST